MKNKRIRMIGIAMIVLVFIWVFTGGIVIERRQYISPGVYKKGEYAPIIYAGIDQGIKNYGIPFLLQYSTDSIPYGISLYYVSHKVPPGSALCFSEIKLIYVDGHKLDIMNSISEKYLLKLYNHYYLDDKGNEQRNSSAVRTEINLGHCIDSRQKFSLHLVGYVKYQENTVERFDVTLNFDSKTEFDVSTGWIWYFKSNYGA
jgi:hypothetical protein